MLSIHSNWWIILFSLCVCLWEIHKSLIDCKADSSSPMFIIQFTMFFFFYETRNIANRIWCCAVSISCSISFGIDSQLNIVLCQSRKPNRLNKLKISFYLLMRERELVFVPRYIMKPLTIGCIEYICKSIETSLYCRIETIEWTPTW